MRLKPFIVLVLVVGVCAEIKKFVCYAPPFEFGPWADPHIGIFGETPVKVSVYAQGDVDVICKIKCCGHTAEFYDEILCAHKCLDIVEVCCMSKSITGTYVVVTEDL